jgi:hypothetical protein
MSTFAAIATAAQSFAQSLMGETFTIANISYTGVVDRIARDLTLEQQGIRPEVDLVIVASKAQFASAPTTRNDVVYDSVTYSVRDVQTDTQAYTLQLRKLS